MEKSLDRKLQSIHADPTGSKEFIIADAKDADMAFGIGAPGLSPERHDQELKYKTLAEYRDQIREVIQQEVVDIVLMSASSSGWKDSLIACETISIGQPGSHSVWPPRLLTGRTRLWC